QVPADKRITFAASRTMSRYESILSQLYEILGPYTPEGQSLSEDTEFISDLGPDSMRVMQLLLDTEERFDVSIPLNIIPDVRTVGHFARCVQQLVDRGEWPSLTNSGNLPTPVRRWRDWARTLSARRLNGSCRQRRPL